MGLDSVELVMAFEEEFGCVIVDSDAAQMATPRHVIDWLETADREDRLFHKLTPKPAPEGWWAKIGYNGTQLRSEGLVERRVASNAREFIREKVFEIIREQIGVKKVWEDARFVEDLRID